MNKRLTLEECADAAGSINNPTNPPVVPNPYVPPDLCIGDYTIGQDPCANEEQAYQESMAAEQLNISGAALNVFKLLGIHEQGKLIDLVGNGQPLGENDPANAFDTLTGSWSSAQTGATVTQSPAYIGYDFGVRKTSYGLPENAPGVADAQHITSIRITQGPDAETRALQVRIERSNGGYCLDPLKITTGANVGNGSVGKFYAGVDSVPGFFMLFATSPTKFFVSWQSASGTQILGEAAVGTQFDSLVGSFTIMQGSIAYAVNDSFMLPIDMMWLRVDVVNLPNMGTPALIRIKQSSASRYWRVIPTSFAGVLANKPWVVDKLELFDYQATTLDDIQDTLFMENRDRDYAKSSILLRVAYTPFDAVSDLSKFGFQITDIYTFTVSFAAMVLALGRPIVVGDVLELPSELQYDHNLRPVKKFLEVTDTAWAADGYTTSWKPITYRFQAQQLIPGREHRDLVGTIDTQKYTIDDSAFFSGVQQIQTAPLTVTEANEAEAIKAVPEKGTNVREEASGTNRFTQPGSYDGVGYLGQDGLPPDGQPYTTSINKLPDVVGVQDGAFHRVEYPPNMKIPARLYKFSIVKNEWLWIETDRRGERNALRPSQQAIFNLDERYSPTTKKL